MSQSLLDPGQIVKHSYDDAQEALKVTIVSGINVDVDLDNSSDNVLVYGYDGATNQPIKTDANGELQVDILSSALPTGAATADNQTNGSQVTQLSDGTDTAEISAAGELSVLATAQPGVDIGDVTINNAAGADAVNIQDGGNSITVDGSVTVSATDLDIRDLSSASDSISAVQSGTWNINDISGTISLPTGAATSAIQTNKSQYTRITDGTDDADVTAAGALKVDGSAVIQPVSQSGSWSLKIAGKSKVDLVRYDYTGTPVTTAAYVELLASTSADASELYVFDSSGETLVFAVGASSSEVDQFYIVPGGNGVVPLSIPSGSRLSVKAVSATASVGELTINLFS